MRLSRCSTSYGEAGMRIRKYIKKKDNELESIYDKILKINTVYSYLQQCVKKRQVAARKLLQQPGADLCPGNGSITWSAVSRSVPFIVVADDSFVVLNAFERGMEPGKIISAEREADSPEKESESSRLSLL